MKPCPWDDPTSPPPHVNELGHRFWPDRESTDYAARKGVRAHVYFVELACGHRTRLIAVDGQPVNECQQLDGIGCYIDMMAVAKDYDDGTVA